VDAGIKVCDLQEAGVAQYVVWVANNFTARRNMLPEYRGVGRMPVYGELIRLLERKYKEKTQWSITCYLTIVLYSNLSREFR
jgi:hypothetical protein